MVQNFLSARKLWLAVFGVGVFLFFSGNTQIVFAETYAECTQRFGNDAVAAARACSGLLQQGSANAQTSEDVTGEPPAGSCNLLTGFDITTCVGEITAYLSQILVQLSSYILGISGIFLNKVIEYTIVDAQKNIVGDANLRHGIQTAWGLIRDLVNMSFIFILLYQSIKMIIGQASDASKVVIKVVAVALLINFSMFITQVVIDASNVVSIGFYDAIAKDTTGEVSDGGISNSYMSALGIQSGWSGNPFATANNLGYTITVQNLMITVFILVTAFVFIAAVFMLIARYIMLILLMILSPVALAGYILPGTQQMSGKWWETLTGQALFAPIFMIMTWINLTFFSSITINKNLRETLDALNGGGEFDPSVVSVLFNFSLIIGMAIASLIISKQFANKGGAGFGKISGAIGGAALSGSAFLGRNTVGRFGASVASSQSLKDRASKGGFTGYAAKMALKSGDYTGSATYDARNTGLGVGKTIFGDMGKGTKAGYSKRVEEKAKKEFEFAKSLGADPRILSKYDDEKKRLQDEEKERRERIKSTKRDIEVREKRGEDVSLIKARLARDINDSKTNKTELENIDKNIKTEKSRRMSSYQKVLERGPFGIREIIARTEKERGVNESILAANREAASKIDKELKKKPKDKLLDDLSKELKSDSDKSKKDEDEDKDEE